MQNCPGLGPSTISSTQTNRQRVTQNATKKCVKATIGSDERKVTQKNSARILATPLDSKTNTCTVNALLPVTTAVYNKKIKLPTTRHSHNVQTSYITMSVT